MSKRLLDEQRPFTPCRDTRPTLSARVDCARLHCVDLLVESHCKLVADFHGSFTALHAPVGGVRSLPTAGAPDGHYSE